MCDNKIEKNHKLCKIINIQLPSFYDNIYIPYKMFKDADFDIQRVLSENTDSLFYNELYMCDNQKSRFDVLFSKYCAMISEIMCANSTLYMFMQIWTNTSAKKWRVIQNNSYLKSLLVHNKYQIISPAHITNVFATHLKTHKDKDLTKNYMETYLNDILSKCRNVLKTFSQDYNKYICDYVYLYPASNAYDHKCKIFNEIIELILGIIEKLLDLNIYTIHPIIINYIQYYMPLDEINSYDPLNNEDKSLIIV